MFSMRQNFKAEIAAAFIGVTTGKPFFAQNE
jgi:hypothetical protein